ncbi:MAG: 50S ribosomal protein L24 [Pseudomonadota bacterium]|nr:50S ribosomal protein L24 [Pseudomonadota bacterium]
MNKIQKNDRVKIIVGKDKGKFGTVKKLDHPYCYIEGLNLVSKCVKANPRANEQGGIKKIEAPIHVSNVALVDKDDKVIKVGIKLLKDGKKVRMNKITKKELGE